MTQQSASQQLAAKKRHLETVAVLERAEAEAYDL